jgi:hypothetical protein
MQSRRAVICVSAFMRTAGKQYDNSRNEGILANLICPKSHEENPRDKLYLQAETHASPDVAEGV